MRRYTGHTLAKFVVTLATAVVTGAIAVALSKAVEGMTDYKLNMLQETMTGALADWSMEMEVDPTFGKTVLSFFKFWLFGSVLVAFATAMARCS